MPAVAPGCPRHMSEYRETTHSTPSSDRPLKDFFFCYDNHNSSDKETDNNVTAMWVNLQIKTHRTKNTITTNFPPTKREREREKRKKKPYAALVTLSLKWILREKQ